MTIKKSKTIVRSSWLRVGWLLPLALAVAAGSEAATKTVVDTTARFNCPSIKIGGDGLGLLAYYDEDNANLKVAHCNDLACTSAAVTVLDSLGDMGQEVSLAIGSDGFGLLAYLNYTDHKLKVAHCDNAACSSAAFSTLGDADGAIAMAMGSDSRGLIVHSRSFEGLKVAHCNDVACTTATSSSVLAVNGMYDTAVAVGSDGYGLIAFMDALTERLKVAHCNDVACTSSTVTEIDVADCHTWLTRPVSVASGPDGLGLIAYTDMNLALKVAHCENLACTSATTVTVKSSIGDQDVGFTIGADSLALIGYAHQNDMMLAHCNNKLCTRASFASLETEGLAQNKSLTLGGDGVPLMGYFMYEGFYLNRLKVAHLTPPPLFDVIFADGFDYLP